MEINTDFGIPVMELDQLIRRALQGYYMELRPPATIWGSIQRHLVERKRGVPGHLTRGFHYDTTSITTQPTVKGRKDNGPD